MCVCASVGVWVLRGCIRACMHVRICMYYSDELFLTLLLTPSQKSAGSSGLDIEFISSSLLARLGDDDPTVVAAVLSIKPKVPSTMLHVLH